MFRKLKRRLRLLARREQVESEMDDEMRFHLEMEVQDNLRAGMGPGEARRRAVLAFGGLERFKERAREERGGRLLDEWMQDFKLAFRKIVRAPAFALVILVTMGLGIGANTAIFTVVDSILLRPLPYPSPDRLVRVYTAAPERNVTRGAFSLLNGRDWAAESRTMVAFGLYTTMPGGLVHTDGVEAREVSTAYVTPGFFQALDLAPLFGQVLREEDEYGDNRALVLSYRFWTRELGADPTVVGRTLDMEGEPYRVAGVMPPAFAFPSPDVEAWTFLTVIPETSIPLHNRGVTFLNAVARLRRDVSAAEAEAELSAIAQGLEGQYPGTNRGVVSATVVSLRDSMVGEARPALLLLLAAVGFILLIACANVANLLLARGVGRAQEMALRAALGARRGRMIRQLLTESTALGLMGGTVGLGLAVLGVRLLVRGSAGLLPRAWEVEPNVGVLLFGLLLSLLTGLVFGLLPALTGSRTDLNRELKEGPSRGTTAGGQSRIRRGLVMAQVAVAVVLLVGAGLMIRSLGELRNVDPGFDPDGLLAVSLILSDVRHSERADYMNLYHRILEGYEALPGVEGAAVIRYLPFRGSGETLTYSASGQPSPLPGQEPRAWMLQASEDLFQVMRVPLLDGRVFTPEDGPESPLAVVINETLEAQAFPEGGAVGSTLEFGGMPAQVVGVVGDIHQESLQEAPRPTVYVHQEQIPRIGMTFLIRTSGDPAGLIPSARRVVLEADPDQPVSFVGPVADVVRGSTAETGFLAFLLGAFALLAFSLAVVGIYGLVAHLVATQLNEIGVRLALGSAPGEAFKLVLFRGLAPVFPGLAVGVVLAWILSRFMTDLLFAVEPGDPTSYVAGSVLLAGAATLATLVPAFRAMRLDPAKLLRYE